MAWGLGPSALIYNKKLAKKFGLNLNGEITLQDFVEVCVQISSHSQNDGVAAFGLAKNIDIIYNLYPFFSAFSADVVDDGGQIVIDHAEMELAFRWIKELLEKSRVAVGEDLRELRRYLLQDKLVFLQDGPWIGGILREETGFADISEHFGVLVIRAEPMRHSRPLPQPPLAISAFLPQKDIRQVLWTFLPATRK